MALTQHRRDVLQFFLEQPNCPHAHIVYEAIRLHREEYLASMQCKDAPLALFFAAQYNNVSAIAYLADCPGFDFDKLAHLEHQGCTPLMFGAYCGHLPAVQALHTKGVSLNHTARNGMTALHYACRGGHVNIVQWLLQHGSFGSGHGALQHALRKGQQTIVEMLLNHGMELPPDALCAAVTHRHTQLATWLVQRLPTLCAGKDKLGRTPLLCAAAVGSAYMMTVIKHSGVDADARDAGERHAMHWAAYCGDLLALQWCMDNTTNWRTPDKAGRYVIHMAALGGHAPAVEWLWHQGANVAIPDKRGHTALTLAVLKDHVQVLRFMLHSQCAADLGPDKQWVKVLMSQAALCNAQQCLTELKATLANHTNVNTTQKLYH